MSVKTKIKTIGWSVLGLCCIVLLVSAIKAKGSKACAAVDVKIGGASQNIFIKKADVLDVLNANGIRAGETLNDINLRRAEDQLEHNAWIKDAQLFFDNHQTLHVNISEREPVARVLTLSGNSFYIDSTGFRLPVNENATARVIVFTSFPSDKKILATPDSLVLNDIKVLARYINADSFLTDQTAQVNITQHGTYELIPVVGNQVIRIGNADSLHEKFTKLLAFYKQVFNKVGFEKYSVIDVQYEGEVVAVKRGEGYTISDTATAMKQLKQADNRLNNVMNDTVYSAPVVKPVVDSVKTVSAKQSTKKTSSSITKNTGKNKNYNSSKAVKSSSIKNKKAGTKKPKAVMKKKR